MISFTLPTKTQLHLCLNQTEANVLCDLIELHLLQSIRPGEELDAERELKFQLGSRAGLLEGLSTSIVKEMRSLGWSLTAHS